MDARSLSSSRRGGRHKPGEARPVADIEGGIVGEAAAVGDIVEEDIGPASFDLFLLAGSELDETKTTNLHDLARAP